MTNLLCSGRVSVASELMLPVAVIQSMTRSFAALFNCGATEFYQRSPYSCVGVLTTESLVLFRSYSGSGYYCCRGNQ